MSGARGIVAIGEQREIAWPDVKATRDKKRAAGVCINGPLDAATARATYRGQPVIVHGPVVKGGKCQRCVDIHSGSSDKRYAHRRVGRLAHELATLAGSGDRELDADLLPVARVVRR